MRRNSIRDVKHDSPCVALLPIFVFAVARHDDIMVPLGI